LVALLASAALIGQAQAGDPHGGGFGGRSFNGGGHAVGGGVRAGPVEVERFPWRWLPRSSPGVGWCAQILWNGARGGELASAYRAYSSVRARPSYRQPVYNDSWPIGNSVYWRTNSGWSTAESFQLNTQSCWATAGGSV